MSPGWRTPSCSCAFTAVCLSFPGSARNLVIASGNNAALGLTTGQLSSMFTYTTQILSSLMMLSMVAFVMLTMSRAP